MFNNAKTSSKRIKAQITAIGNRNKTLRSMIQSTLCEISAHVYEHGDVTLFTHLLDEVKGQDRKAMIDWIEEYGFAKIKSEGTFGKDKKAVEDADFTDGQAVYDEYTHADWEGKAWFDFVKSTKQIAKDMTVDQMLGALLKRVKENEDPDFDLKGKARSKVVLESTEGGFDNMIRQFADWKKNKVGAVNATVPELASVA
jgi:hypothetical protein